MIRPPGPAISLGTDTGRRPIAPVPFARAIVIGAAGGALFSFFGLPLAWMLGSMLFTTAACFAGVRLEVAPAVQRLMMIVLGLMIGSAFTPELLAGLPLLSVSLLTLPILIAVGAAVAWLHFRRLSRFDAVTAYFCTSPGGMANMILLGGAMRGDGRAIGPTHAIRVFLVVMVVPFWIRLTMGAQPVARGSAAGLAEVDAAGLAALAPAGGAGYLIAGRLWLPAPAFLGPLLASAGIHLASLTAAQPP